MRFCNVGIEKFKVAKFSLLGFVAGVVYNQNDDNETFE